MSDTVAVPVDVRLMNATAALLLLAFAGLCLFAAGRYVVGLAAFELRTITVSGDTGRSNALTMRASVAPKVHGTFFTVHLDKVREAFESMPWVRHAVVRREFPNRLRVELEEHKPVAYWDEPSNQRLVNSFGEVFEANVGEVEQEGLPHLGGPSGRSAEVLAMFERIKPELERIGQTLVELQLSGRGSWQARLEGDAVIELGRGSEDEIQERLLRFTHTLTQVAAHYGRTPQALQFADLRHENGYALRLQGVAIEPPPANGAKGK